MAEFEPQRRPDPSPTVAPLKSAREMPHNVEAEQAVLGAILIDENAFDLVAGRNLRPGDFYVLAHQHVYDVCVDLAKEGKKIDPVLVAQRLDAKGFLGSSVPRDLVWVLAKSLGTASNSDHYARVVQDLSRLRQMMLTAQRVVERGYEAGANVQNFLEAAQQDVFGAAAGLGIETLRPIGEPVLQAMENLEAIQLRVKAGLSPVTGVPTGIQALDKMMLGLQPGALAILAARPSVGKTAFALNIAAHAATKHERKVAVFSLEMPSDQLALRMLASEARLDWRRLSQGQMSNLDWEKVNHHGSRLTSANIWLDDNFVLTPVELRSKCRKLKRERGLDLVVVDYLQLMHAPSDRGTQSREQEIATISRSLKALAKELSIPVLALSQLNRGVEKRKGEPPMLSDLRESGAIEQDADVVMFLHREEAEDRDGPPQPVGDTQQIQLILAKQRQGPTGTVELVFFRPSTFFAERTERRGE